MPQNLHHHTNFDVTGLYSFFTRPPDLDKDVIRVKAENARDRRLALNENGIPLKVIFINGILNDRESAMRSGDYLSMQLGGAEVHVILNQSHGLLNDCVKAFSSRRFGLCSNPSSTYANLIHQFDAQTNDNFAVASFNHSMGAIIANRATESLPTRLQNKIHAIGIAPAEPSTNPNLASSTKLPQPRSRSIYQPENLHRLPLEWC